MMIGRRVVHANRIERRSVFPATFTRTATRNPTKQTQCAFLSSFTRGHDLTYESLSFGQRPKVILQGYGPTGFDVMNVIKKVDPDETSESGALHMNGSVLCVPHGCFLWNIQKPSDVTFESLAPVLLLRPALEYLFLGCNHSDDPIPLQELDRIKDMMKSHNIVVESMSLANAMGTFNILNAEDRQAAAALVLDPSSDGDEERQSI